MVSIEFRFSADSASGIIQGHDKEVTKGTSMRNATKRTVASIAVSLLTASALVGIGTSAQAATAANTITFSVPKPGGGQASPYVAIAEGFNKKYPTYKVNIVETETAVYPTSLQTKLRAGNGPDVFMVQPGAGQINSALPFIKAKYLADLSDTDAPKSNPKGIAGSVGVGGKTYAVAIDQTAGALVYNKSLLDADGLEWPATFRELLVTCKAAVALGKTVFGFAGSQYANGGLMLMNMSGAHVYASGDSWNSQRNAGKVKFATSSGWKTTLSEVTQMEKAGCFQPGAAAGGFQDAIDARFFGKKSYAVFVPGGTSVAFSKVPALAGQNLKTGLFPGSPRLPVSSNYALAVYAKSKKMAAAKKFINYASTAAAQALGQAASGNLPVQKIDPAKLPVQYSEIARYLKYGKTYSFPNQMWGAPEVYVKLGSAPAGLITGQATVDQVLKSLDAAWK